MRIEWMKRSAFLMVWVLPVAVVIGLALYMQGGDDRPKNHDTLQPTPYRLVEIANGFDRPIYVTHAGDGSGRLFVVEQSGQIKIIDGDTVLAAPFLDVSGLISQSALSGSYTEQGLLGLAFHPEYATNGVFFVDYTDRSGNTVLARYRVAADDPNRADPDSAEALLYVTQPFANHNGGHLAFGPDGYLYVTFGDGGSGGDPQGNGQNLGTLLGSILRLDVDTDEGYAIPEDNPFVGRSDARPEIWAWGLRNVWRFSFDHTTGDLFLADVGQNQWEEINFQTADSAGGANYGWNAYEGLHGYSGAAAASDIVEPILEYDHNNGRCSVTGGYVYRGAALPDLQGYYLYGDWCTGTIWAAQPDAEGNWQAVISLESGRQISSFGEDETGELYLVDHGGAVLRFVP
jgi:glucose/arabinose dehydrogenase